MIALNRMITIRRRRGADVLQFPRREVLDPACVRRASDEVQRYLDATARCRVVLDLANIRLLTSATLAMIVHMHQVIERRGGRVGIANLDEHLRGVFRVTRLDTLVRVFESVDAAIDSFEAPPADGA